MFSLDVLPEHPWSEKKGDSLHQTLVLYDNAGEHFQSGRDSASDPGTRHLVQSEGMFFVFDPTKNVAFRELCESEDPQMRAGARVERQEPLLTEALERIKRHSGNASREDLDRPLVVIVTKYDAWQSLLNWDLPQPWTPADEMSVAGLDQARLRATSLAVRDLLQRVTPEVVATAESFSSRVIYLPTSALGHSPTLHQQENGAEALLVRPCDVRPVWVAVPMLYMLALFGMIPVVKTGKTPDMPVAEDSRPSGDKVTLTVPGTERQMKVPQSYRGSVVRCPRTGRWFWLPGPEDDIN
jgi:hypothetical protein